MIFQEKQLEEGYLYTVTDVFGTVTISSKREKLDGRMLDTIVMGVLKAGANEGKITADVTFTFKPASNWLLEDEGVKPDAKPKEQVSPKSRTAAFLLSLFLGGFGIHNFYIGKPGVGIAQLLLSLSFIGIIVSAPWALYDCIVIACGRMKDDDGMPILNW
jgi:TM2 domain-containing membrane protein YozV